MKKILPAFAAMIVLFIILGNYCSDPTFSGGRNYILNWFFFVQSILADRYIHCRELCAVSLESPSSVEYGIKKFFFLIFVFTWSCRSLNFEEGRVNSVVFVHIFRNFLSKFLLILLKVS